MDIVQTGDLLTPCYLDWFAAWKSSKDSRNRYLRALPRDSEEEEEETEPKETSTLIIWLILSTLFFNNELAELKKYWLLVPSSLLQVRRGCRWPAVLLNDDAIICLSWIIHFWESRKATIIFSVRTYESNSVRTSKLLPFFLSSAVQYTSNIYELNYPLSSRTPILRSLPSPFDFPTWYYCF